MESWRTVNQAVTVGHRCEHVWVEAQDLVVMLLVKDCAAAVAARRPAARAWAAPW
jgi:hypothetical protein